MAIMRGALSRLVNENKRRHLRCLTVPDLKPLVAVFAGDEV
jgi:hypothetical protein